MTQPQPAVSRLLLVDGHAFAYRAFYAIRELRGPDGRATNAIYGFVKMLDKMRTTVQPEGLAVLWDGGLSPERMTAWPAYKAQRPEMPDDLRPQLDGIRAWLAASGVTDFCRDDWEADDVIATLARRAAAAGRAVVIASADKDFMQLVSDRIGLLNPAGPGNEIWTADDVRAKTGVNPEQVAEWLALMGDAVDNIPGVPGVGPKTAAALLQQFGSLAELFRRLPEVRSERIRTALRDGAGAVERNLALVRLAELPVPLEDSDLRPRPADPVRQAGLLREWGFRTLLAALDGRPAAPPPELSQAELI